MKMLKTRAIVLVATAMWCTGALAQSPNPQVPTTVLSEDTTPKATALDEPSARSQVAIEALRILRLRFQAAQDLPPASADRAAAIDQVYLSARSLVERLINDRDQAIAAQHEAEADETSTQLIAVRKLRRAARTSTSAAVLVQLQDARLKDIQSEITSIPKDVESSLRRTRDAWWRAPSDVNQVQALGQLFLSLMKLALALVFGIWIHGRIPAWCAQFMDNIEPGRDGGTWEGGARFPPWVIAGDLAALALPLSGVLQDLIVFGTAWMVMGWLGDPAAPIVWVALIFACAAAVRLASGAIRLALITPAETRPALAVIEPSTQQALLWIAAVFGTLLSIDIVIIHLLVEILYADQLALLLSDAIGFVAILLIVLGIHRWGDTLRARVALGGTVGTAAKWVANASPLRLTGLLSALVAIVLLSGRLLFALAQGLIESRAGLSWLGAAIARHQLRDDDSSPRTPLDVNTRNAIAHGALHALHRDDQLAEMTQLYTAWVADPRRGLVALTGDRGVGKSALLDKLNESLPVNTIRATAPTGYTHENSALNWLIRTTQITASPNTESVIAALMAQPGQVFLLSDLHRLFLRAVGHYAGLDAVLDVMQATGRHHFWVASIHGPAWSFLAGMKHVGNVGIFPHRVHLGPTSPADLSAWLHARTKAAGFKPRFDGLTQQRAAGQGQARLLERAERAYWRLMAEASQGNPTVAARLWIDGLQPTSSAGVLDVGVPRSHDSTELEGLTDSELFGLTAIILHEDISVAELALVLNLAEARVRAACRGLEQLTLITETDTARYKVRLNWLPAVERYLRRRSFLHKG